MGLLAVLLPPVVPRPSSATLSRSLPNDVPPPLETHHSTTPTAPPRGETPPDTSTDDPSGTPSSGFTPELDVHQTGSTPDSWRFCSVRLAAHDAGPVCLVYAAERVPLRRVGVTELPSGTVTFLFTDLEGSTRLWE